MNSPNISRRLLLSMIGSTAMTYAMPVNAIQNTLKDSAFLMPKAYKPTVLAWLNTMQDPQSGLFYYMDKGIAHFLSPLATAKTLIWAAKLNNSLLVKRSALALVKAQQALSQQYPNFSGAVASSYTIKNNQLIAGTYIYASEQLVVLYALLEAYQYLKEESYLKHALELGAVLKSVFFNGVALGAWKKSFPIPFHYITVSGAYENSMRNSVEFLWIMALEKLSVLTGNLAWHTLYENAVEFYLEGYARNGLWFDVFYPDQKKWTWLSKDNVIADNTLRCAIAAKLHQQSTPANELLSLFKGNTAPLVYGYLSQQDIDSGFLKQDTPYYDVVSTALLRDLAGLCNQTSLALHCQKTLKSLMDTKQGGGFFWGVYSHNLQPLAQEKAIITTLWATVNMHPNVKTQQGASLASMIS